LFIVSFSFKGNGGGNGDGKMPPPKVNGAKREDLLTKKNWQDVLERYAKTGKPSEIASQLGLAKRAVEDLIEHGIPRLGLPGIRDYSVDTAELHLDLHRQREVQQASLKREDVTEAITERAISEAAVAQNTLAGAGKTGIIIGAYVDELLKRVQAGHLPMAFPEALTPSLLEDLAKAMKANAEATEKAVKLMRLTAGEPTELIEHKIAGLVATCTTEELREAALNGRIPRRLTSRLGSSADPLQSRDGAASASASDEAGIIDVDFTNSEAPSWLAELTQPEQFDSSSEDGSDSTVEDDDA
jgi:hypothetical protein